MLRKWITESTSTSELRKNYIISDIKLVVEILSGCHATPLLMICPHCMLSDRYTNALKKIINHLSCPTLRNITLLQSKLLACSKNFFTAETFRKSSHSNWEAKSQIDLAQLVLRKYLLYRKQEKRDEDRWNFRNLSLHCKQNVLEKRRF